MILVLEVRELLSAVGRLDWPAGEGGLRLLAILFVG
jgi:hypothetical protein